MNKIDIEYNIIDEFDVQNHAKGTKVIITINHSIHDKTNRNNY